MCDRVDPHGASMKTKVPFDVWFQCFSCDLSARVVSKCEALCKQDVRNHMHNMNMRLESERTRMRARNQQSTCYSGYWLPCKTTLYSVQA